MSIQLIVDGVTVYQSDAATPPAPEKPPAPVFVPTVYVPPPPHSGAVDIVDGLSAANGANLQVHSKWLNSGTPNVDTAAFRFTVPPDATGTRVIEFTNASFATNAFVRAAISRRSDDATGADGFAFPSRMGAMIDGSMEFSVNSGTTDVVLTAGDWYLVLQIVDIAALQSLPNGYQADRLAWLRDTTAR